ncbi:hypothetical protein FACS1894181_09370 [Bacteroidia bacterium]|nr:hypothetical protein FACS1894181_09370 [Bacteroidia bacterium]
MCKNQTRGIIPAQPRTDAINRVSTSSKPLWATLFLALVAALFAVTPLTAFAQVTTVTTGTYSSIYGNTGDAIPPTDATANGNTLTLGDGTNGSAEYNKVAIDGGTLNNVRGSVSYNYAASHNEVIINGGTIGDNVSGRLTTIGSATDNIVNITTTGNTAMVSVRPKTRLAAGTYTGTLDITGNNGLSTSLSFTVNAPAYGISISSFTGGSRQHE